MAHLPKPGRALDENLISARPGFYARNNVMYCALRRARRQ